MGTDLNNLTRLYVKFYHHFVICQRFLSILGIFFKFDFTAVPFTFHSGTQADVPYCANMRKTLIITGFLVVFWYRFSIQLGYRIE
jgi:hypothetical protein